MSYQSKYTGKEVEKILDHVAYQSGFVGPSPLNVKIGNITKEYTGQSPVDIHIPLPSDVGAQDTVLISNGKDSIPTWTPLKRINGKTLIGDGNITISNISEGNDNVYVSELTPTLLSNQSDVRIDFAAWEDAIRNNKIIKLYNYSVVVNAELVGWSAEEREIRIVVILGGYIYTATAYSSTSAISASSKTKRLITTNDYVNQELRDLVYYYEDDLENLLSGLCQVDFASLLYAIYHRAIIRVRSGSSKLYTALAYATYGDKWIILQIIDVNTVHSIRIERDSTDPDKGNVTTVISKDLVYTDYLDSVVGDINTLLETIIAG